MQTYTVLKPGAENLDFAKGDTGATGATGAIGPAATPKNVRLIKTIVTITPSGPAVTYELVLEQGDIWEAISAAQFTLDATKMYGNILNFLNAANNTKKVKAVIEQDSVVVNNMSYPNISTPDIRITNTSINDIEWGLFDPQAMPMDWTDISLFPNLLSYVMSFNVYLIAED